MDFKKNAWIKRAFAVLVIVVGFSSLRALGLTADPLVSSTGNITLSQDNPDYCLFDYIDEANGQKRETTQTRVTQIRRDLQGNSSQTEYHNEIMPTGCAMSVSLAPGDYEFSYWGAGAIYTLQNGQWVGQAGYQESDSVKAYVQVIPEPIETEFDGHLDLKNYDIYYGDIDGYGRDKDIYFHAKDQFIMLHSDITIPILMPHKPSFAFYQIGTSGTRMEYSDAFSFRATEEQLSNLEKVDVSSQLAFGDLNGDGHLDAYVKGRTVNEPALVVLSGAAGQLPSSSTFYDVTEGDYVFRVSAVGSAVSLEDKNGDGKDDIVYRKGDSWAEWYYSALAVGGISTETQFNEEPDYLPADLVGASSGEFRVNEAGAATYNFALDMPEGTAGVKPSVSLHYSSTAGDGDLGKGWSLSAHQSIAYCRKTLFVDGEAGRLNLDDQDALCLNGRRLIKDGDHYYPQINGHNRISRVGTGADSSFVMEGKDGSLRFFGSTTNSVEKAAGTGDVLSWAESAACDSAGNCVRYEYLNRPGKQLLLDRILYAFGGGNSPGAEVKIDYQDRPASKSKYVAGNLIETDKLVKSVTVYGGVNRQQLRRYDIHYTSVTPYSPYAQSFVLGIQECVQASCLPPTTFDWLHNSGLDFHDNMAWETQLLFERGGAQIPQLIPLDFDGDGFQDIAWIEYDDEFGNGPEKIRGRIRHARFDPVQQRYIHMNFAGDDDDIYVSADDAGAGVMSDHGKIILQAMDYNADGMMDLAVYKNGYDQWSIYPSIPNTSSSVTESLWRLSAVDSVDIYADNSSVLIDVDSDGLLDVLSYEAINKLQVSDSGSAQFPNAYQTPVALDPETVWDYQARSFRVYTGPELSSPNQIIFNQATVTRDLVPVGDLDGDGMADVLMVERQLGRQFMQFIQPSPHQNYERCAEIGEHYYVMLNLGEGNGFKEVAYLGAAYQAEDLELKDCSPDADRALLKQVTFPDANGDGYADLMVGTDDDIQFFLSSGNYQWVDTPSAEPENPFVGLTVSDDGMSISGGQVLTAREGDSNSAKNALQFNQKLYLNFIDIDGDGHLDFLTRRMTYSEHTDHTNQEQFRYKLWRPNSGSFADSFKTLNVKRDNDETIENHYFFDADGDGHVDHLRSYNKHLQVRLNKVDGFNDVIENFTTGLGAKTHIAYENLNLSDHYQSLQDRLRWERYISTDLQQVDISALPRLIRASFMAMVSQQASEIPVEQYYAAIRSPFNHVDDEDQSIAGGLQAPVFEVIAPIPIVTRVTGDTPGLTGSYGDWGTLEQEQTSSIEYFYSLARMQAGGVGHLGFRSVATRDNVNDTIVETRYRQDWPFVGYPELTVTYEPDENLKPGQNLNDLNIQSLKRNRWELHGWSDSWPTTVANDSTSALGVMKPYVGGSEEVSFSFETESEADPTQVVAQLNAQGPWCDDYPQTRFCALFPQASEQKVKRYQTTSQAQDEYGNVDELTTFESYQGISKTVSTQNEYGSGTDTVSFLTIDGFNRSATFRELGRLTETTVVSTQTRDDSTESVTNQSAFDYYTSGRSAGLLKSEEAFSSTSVVASGSSWDNDDLYKVVTEYDYDDLGNPFRTTTKAKEVAFDQDGNRVPSVNGELIRSVETQYDPSGRFVDETTEFIDGVPYVVERVTVRAANGAPRVVENDLNELIQQIDYDALGREISSFDNVGANQGVGAWEDTHYLKCGGSHCPEGTAFYIEKSSFSGAVARTYFDRLGRTMRESTLGHDGQYWVHVDTHYDQGGRIARVSQPFKQNTSPQFWTESQYDKLGRVVTSKAANGGESHIQYKGYQTITTSPLGRKKRETRNPMGELVEVAHLSGGGAVRYKYNTRGDLIEVSRGTLYYVVGPDQPAVLNSAGTVEFEYDALGRKIKMIDPDKGTWQYRYNAFGELLWQKDGKGQVVINRYDATGRQLERTDYRDDGTVENHTRWFYDGKTETSDQVISSAVGQVSAVVHRDTNQGDVTCSLAGGAKECIYNTYDEFGRSVSTEKQLYADGKDLGRYTTSAEYDNYGRVSRQYDALNNTVKNTNGNDIASGLINHYGPVGQLSSVEDILSGDEVYKVTDANVRGQVKTLLMDNGVMTSYSYEDSTGLLTGKVAVNSLSQDVQSLAYSWDIVGNLKTRVNQGMDGFGQFRNIQESFCYTSTNRLSRAYFGFASNDCDAASASGVEYTEVKYLNVLGNGPNKLGHIASKITHMPDGSTKGVKDYVYKIGRGGTAVAGPNAVTSATEIGFGARFYNYDANGNMTSVDMAGGREKSIDYATFDKATRIHRAEMEPDQWGRQSPTSRTSTTRFEYGSERNRYWRKDSDSESGNTVETVYLGNVERIIRGNKVIWKRYLGGVAIYEVETSASNQQLDGTQWNKTFIHKDHLGSVDVLTNNNGQVTETMSFDPWGQRRDAETGEQLDTHALLARADWQQTINGEHQYGAYRLASLGRTTRGFTGHEMLDEAGLIHMNGRLYDPLLGRFVQADPFVQAPDNPDSYDRYAYVLNNPLSATDPSGYISSFFYEFKRAAGFVATVAYTAACLPSGTCNPGVYAAIAAAGAMVAGADGEGILLAAVTAYVGGQIGGSDMALGSKIAASATLGGVTAVISGGSIGHSMVSAGIGALFGGSEMAEVLGGSKVLQVGMAAIVGGTQSELTGGKFKNGAGMAGFMALVSLASNAANDDQSPIAEMPKGFNAKGDIDHTKYEIDTEGVSQEDIDWVNRRKEEILKRFPALKQSNDNVKVIVANKITHPQNESGYSIEGVYLADNTIAVAIGSRSAGETVGTLLHEMLHVDEAYYISDGSWKEYLSIKSVMSNSAHEYIHNAGDSYAAMRKAELHGIDTRHMLDLSDRPWLPENF